MQLGVTRKALSERVNRYCGISPEMAISLSKAFGGSSETWLRLQLQYDLWQAEKHEKNIKATHSPGAHLAANNDTIEAMEATRNGELFSAEIPDHLLESLNVE